MTLLSFKNHVQKIRDFFIDTLYPIHCLSCNKEGYWLCNQCKNKITYNHNQKCPQCKKRSPLGQFCNHCKNNHHLEGIIITSSYNQKIISKLIKTMKYNFIPDIAKILGEHIYTYINHIQEINSTLSLNKFTIIPIPLHIKRKNWRGFNQTEIMAKSLNKKLNIKLNTTHLTRIKNKKAQALLKASERKTNIKNCFHWQGSKINNKNYLLIDDVVSTGSTLEECAKILKQNGANKIWAIVIASN